MILREAVTGCLVLCLTLAGPAATAAEHSHSGYGSKSAMPHRAAAGDKKMLPTIRIVAPVSGAQVGPDLAVDFDTDADLVNMTMGAKAIGVHLHVDIDGTSLMPTLADLKRLGKNRYRYAFDMPAAPGPHLISVYWSDAQHKTIESTMRRVGVTVVAVPATKRP